MVDCPVRTSIRNVWTEKILRRHPPAVIKRTGTSILRFTEPSTLKQLSRRVKIQMPTPLEKAREYLDALEADRQAALALSEQKAEEAKLIKSRQEGFQAALELLAGASSSDNAEAGPEAPSRRQRRNIRQLIVHELAFCGQTMTLNQIAKAIDYHPDRTETALTRMEKDGQVCRDGADRWAIGTATLTHMNDHAVQAGDSNAAAPLRGVADSEC